MDDKADTLPGGLYALVDDGLWPPDELADVVRACLLAGAGAVQLRLKRTPDRQALALVRAAVAAARGTGAAVLVNDRVDLALLGGARGVHLGDQDLPVADARRVLGPGALIGATVRDLDGARAAQAAGADHVGLGPIFPTRTKDVEHPPLGLERFRDVARASPLPVVGIAGVTLDTIALVAAAGARAAAVASDLRAGGDVRARARALAEAFQRGRRDADLRLGSPG